MLALILLLLSPQAHAGADSWLCQCCENESSHSGISYLSEAGSLSLSEAEAKAAEPCAKGSNGALKGKLVRCLKEPPHVAAVKERRFENLSLEQQTEIKEAYKRVLTAQEQKDYATILAETDFILNRLDDYNDTKAYNSIAKKKLAK